MAWSDKVIESYPRNMDAASMLPLKLDGGVKLSWRDVFNTSHTRWGYITYGHEAAAKAEYPYFLWSGRIYYMKTGLGTGLTEDDVK